MTDRTTRRALLGGGAALGTIAAAGGARAQSWRDGWHPQRRVRRARMAGGHPVIAQDYAARAADAIRLRLAAARDLFGRGRTFGQPTNGDDDRYDDRRASFTKALPHDDLGEVDRQAYERLLDALRRRDEAAFEAVPLSPGATRRLANPQAAYGFVLTGLDPHASRMPAAPAFASDETAGEAQELYWKALLRDVPFRAFEDDPLVARAVADINAGPAPAGGRQTARTVFRSELPADRAGPLVSQLLLRDVPFGNATLTQRYPRPGDGADWGAEYPEWLEVQRGGVRGVTDKRGGRFVHDGRSLAEYVHVDFTYQAYLNAGLILLGLGPDFTAQGSPARTRTTTGSFVTFGAADVVDAVAGAANASLHAAWFQKWAAHRRLRPEAYGGRLHNQLTGAKDYELPSWLGQTEAVGLTRQRQGTALLSQAYPEGSPTPPAYPAGHATVAGACCTVLKAFFDEDMVMPNPVQANAGGTALEPYAGAALTVRGEIDKLASNVTLGRDWAGVHYRSDGIEGLLVGEEVALALLRDRAACYAEDFDGFTLTRFDGTRVRISSRGIG